MLLQISKKNLTEEHTFKITKEQGWKISSLERNYRMFITFRFSCLSKRVTMLSAKRCYMQIYFFAAG